jgi:NAD(P)H-dependent FMN reductase
MEIMKTVSRSYWRPSPRRHRLAPSLVPSGQLNATTFMLKLQVIIGSTRAGRNADAVCHWFLPLARSHGAFEVETVDLRDWPLPFFQETLQTVGDFADPTYSDPLVRRWNDKIGQADAFIIVTPEYNHSIPAVLKNAIDSVFFSFRFRQKAVAFVSYSLGPTAGARAVEHLSQIMVETEAVPVRTPTLVPLVANAFDVGGQPTNPVLPVTMSAMLDDLAWLGNALKTARAAGQLQPAALRIRAASGRK